MRKYKLKNEGNYFGISRNAIKTDEFLLQLDNKDGDQCRVSLTFQDIFYLMKELRKASNQLNEGLIGLIEAMTNNEDDNE